MIIQRLHMSFFFFAVGLLGPFNVAFKLTEAQQQRRLSTFPPQCSYACPVGSTTVDMLLRKGQSCPKTINEGDKFVTGGGIHICRALREAGEVRVAFIKRPVWRKARPG